MRLPYSLCIGWCERSVDPFHDRRTAKDGRHSLDDAGKQIAVAFHGLDLSLQDLDLGLHVCGDDALVVVQLLVLVGAGCRCGFGHLPGH